MAKAPLAQVGAVPWRRRRGRIEVLLITSRETKRWVIPKGWPMPHLIDSNAARQEAFEEAGVKGRVQRKPLGFYLYYKMLRKGARQPCKVTVYSLSVEAQFSRWPEREERTRAWFKAEEAAGMVHEQGLKDILIALVEGGPLLA
jgi:8-oxo-dGTP pyrophosphatase MutT (NUDIX family)